MKVVCKDCGKEQEIADENEYGTPYWWSTCDCGSQTYILPSDRIRMDIDWWEHLWCQLIDKIKNDHGEDLATEMIGFMTTRKWRDINLQSLQGKVN